MREKRLRAFAIAVGLCIVLAFPVMVNADDSDFVIIVYPTGGDDTANLQAAFDAAVLTGPGSTVQLVEGTYSISHTIFVANFDGCFRGAGKGDTIIQTVDGFNAPIWDVFMFYQDSECGATTIRVEDMSVNVVGKSAQEVGLYVFDIYGKLTGIPDYERSYLSVFFEEVEVEGERGIYDPIGLHGGDSNVEEAIWIGGEFIALDGIRYVKPIVGTYSVSECDFRSIWYGIALMTPTDSEVSISHNRAEDVFLGLFDYTMAHNTYAVVEKNFISSEAMGINIYHGWWTWFWGAPLPEPGGIKVSQNTIHLVSEDAYNGIHVYSFPTASGEASMFDVEISHNTVYAPGFADGIIVADRASQWMGIKSINAVVSHNTIVLDDSDYGGIFTIGACDAVIASNLISGNGDYGIIAILCERSMLLGNNLQRFYGVPGEYGFGAPIVLWASSDCAVVGGPSETDVWDIGGYNNVLVGVNNMQGNPPGQDIADAMEMKRDILGLFRGH